MHAYTLDIHTCMHTLHYITSHYIAFPYLTLHVHVHVHLHTVPLHYITLDYIALRCITCIKTVPNSTVAYYTMPCHTMPCHIIPYVRTLHTSVKGSLETTFWLTWDVIFGCRVHPMGYTPLGLIFRGGRGTGDRGQGKPPEVRDIKHIALQYRHTFKVKYYGGTGDREPGTVGTTRGAFWFHVRGGPETGDRDLW